MRRIRPLLPQIATAAMCAGLSLFDFTVAFAFGDTVEGTVPFGWKIALGSVIAIIVLLSAGLGFAAPRFPWHVLLMVPFMMRVFMLRPLQLDLYPVALSLGIYTDLLFLIGAGIGIGLGRLLSRSRLMARQRLRAAR